MRRERARTATPDRSTTSRPPISRPGRRCRPPTPNRCATPARQPLRARSGGRRTRAGRHPAAKADFEDVLAHCDKALAALAKNSQAKAIAVDSLLPALAAERALALLSLGRRDEALAEAAELEGSYPSYGAL